MEQRETPIDDAEYIRRTLAGDRAAFDRVINKYAGMVYAVGLARLGQDFDRSDELTQEVFLRAWLHLDKLSKPENLAAWLCRITRNLAADWKRNDRRKSAIHQLVSLHHADAMSVASDDPSPREILILRQDGVMLDAAFNKMPEDQRELLLLHYSEGLSQSEIADLMRVHPSTIMRKIDRATKRLGALYAKGLTSLGAYRANPGIARRTSAVIAAIWLLDTSQRTSLAKATSTKFSMSIIGDASRFGFKNITGGAAMAGAGLVLSLGMIWVATSELPFGILKDETPRNLREAAVQVLDDDPHKRSASHESSAWADSPQLVQSRPTGEAATAGLFPPVIAPTSQNGYVVSDSQPSCMSLERLQALTQSFEAIAATAQFTFQTSQTVYGITDAENRIDDREGTVTVKNGSYLVRHRRINGPLGKAAPMEEIQFDASTGVVTVTANVPGSSPRHFSDINRHGSADTYNPLRKLLRPPFGSRNDSFSDFLSKESRLVPILTTCTRDSKGSKRVIFGASDWMVRLDPENANFPDYMRVTIEPDDSLRFEKEVTGFASFNGVAYPSQFAVRSYGHGATGDLVVTNATTASIQMFALRNEKKNRQIPTTAVLTTGTITSVRTTESEQLQQQRKDAHHNRILDILKKNR